MGQPNEVEVGRKCKSDNRDLRPLQLHLDRLTPTGVEHRITVPASMFRPSPGMLGARLSSWIIVIIHEELLCAFAAAVP